MTSNLVAICRLNNGTCVYTKWKATGSETTTIIAVDRQGIDVSLMPTGTMENVSSLPLPL